MGQIDALITELLADLEDSVHTTHNEHLEVKLGCDTHEKFHVQVVVEGLEGLGGGSASDHVHHGSLDLGEVSFSQEVPQEVKDLIAGGEDFLDWVVKDEVEVALAVASVLVEHFLFTLPLRQHVHAVGKADDLGRAH